MKETEGFSKEEKAAMRARAKELKREKEGKGEEDVLAAIGKMEGLDRQIGEAIHAIVKANAPDLSPKTWYGMPAYANKDGKVVCFFQSARTFKTRYFTLGFSDQAHLDEGDMWPTGFAIKNLTADVETRITELVKKAVN